MKKSLVILLLFSFIFSMNSKWNLLLNDSNYKDIKFKMSKTYLNKDVGPFKRGIVLADKSKYDANNIYRFTLPNSIVFTNDEGKLNLDMTLAEANQLTNEFYRYFQRRAIIFKSATKVKQIEEFYSTKGIEVLKKRVKRYGGEKKYLKKMTKPPIVKICLVMKYKEGYAFSVIVKGFYKEDRDYGLGGVLYLVKENGKMGRAVACY